MEDEIDLQLRQLAIEAQNHPAGSHQRQIALTQLMDAIERSNKLVHPYKNSWSSDVYEELYSEARVRTFEYMCQNIDTYDSKRAVMGWVNYFLNFRFQDVVDRYMNENKKRVPLPSWDDLENIPSPEPDFFDDGEMLRRFIEEDPEGIFRNTSLQSRPDITLQDVALARLDDKKWETIGHNLGISPQTSCSFFQRNLRKLGDIIRNNLQ